MELFIAFFGVVYYLLKFANHREKSRAVREEFSREANYDEQARQRWFSSVTNRELEEELYEKVSKRSDDVLYEISSSGMYCPVIGTWYDKSWALRILMALRGYLTEEDAKYGIQVYFGKTKEVIVWKYKHMVDTLLYIDKMLRERGVCHDMFLRSVNKYYPFPLNFFPVPGSATSVGRIVWRPMVSSAEMRRSEEILKRAGINTDRTEGVKLERTNNY